MIFEDTQRQENLSGMMKVVVDLEEISGSHENEVALLGGHTLITINTISWAAVVTCPTELATSEQRSSARHERKVETRCTFRCRSVSQCRLQFGLPGLRAADFFDVRWTRRSGKVCLKIFSVPCREF